MLTKILPNLPMQVLLIFNFSLPYSPPLITPIYPPLHYHYFKKPAALPSSCLPCLLFWPCVFAHCSCSWTNLSMFGQNLTRWFFHMYYTGNEWIFAKYVQTRANKHEPMQKCIGCISHDLLPKIISKCSPPIGLKGKCITSSMMMSIVKDLHIPIRYGKVKVCVYMVYV